MVLAVVTSQLLPVVVTIATIAVVIYTLMLCVCGKSKTNEDPELTQVKQKSSTSHDPEIDGQGNAAESDAVHLEIETAITPLVGSPQSSNNTTQNGNLHKRGDSLDLNRSMERHSQASAGSSPRPNAVSRELPEIPIVGKHHQPPTLESSTRGGHDNLPEIPANARLSNTLPANQRLPAVSPTAGRSMVKVTDRKGTSSQEPREGGIKVKSEEDADDYDHLDEPKKKTLKRRSDYDHVLIEQGMEMIIPAKSKVVDENDYAEVKAENIYEGVPDDVTVVSVKGTSKQEVKGEGLKSRGVDENVRSSLRDDDPYNEIKVDEPYTKVKGDFDPYNKIKDDPYNRVKDDDPYNKVKGDDPYEDVMDEPFPRKKKDSYNKVVDDPYALLFDDERDVSNQSSQITDPYAHVFDDISDSTDPYNRVKDDLVEEAAEGTVANIGDDDYATVNKVSNAMDVEYAQVNKTKHLRDGNHGNNEGISSSALGNRSTSNTSIEIVQDEYATVVKVRNAIAAANAETPQSAINRMSSGSAAAPPEPPRDYEQDDQRASTVSVSAAEESIQTTTNVPVPMDTESPLPGDVTLPEGGGARKKEPPYTKLTARESLASMNARIANNTYELVPENDNLYATVEAGSGDRGVQRRTTHSSVEPREGPITEQHYTEISKGGAAAPVPPSLDSLHETAKIHQEEFSRRKADGRPGDLAHYSNMEADPSLGHQRTPSGHFRTPSGHFRTPSGDMANGLVNENVMAPLATESPEFDPDYQSVQETEEITISDETEEFDPNYETVEEANSKVKYEVIKDDVAIVAQKKIRLHVYEEVSVPDESRRTRERVLNQHMYEDITEVKGQNGVARSRPTSQGRGKGQGKGQGQSSNSETEKQKNKSGNAMGHSRKSSSESNKVSRRKSGEMKEKSKESKDKRKSSDGKDSRRKSADVSRK